jgi:hypothetical protein
MALAIIITLTILIFYIFFIQKKKLSFLQNSIVFMLMTIVTTNYITIMSMELKILKTSEDDFLFLFLLILRDIVIPLLVLIFINTYLHSPSMKKKVIFFIVILSILHGMDYLSVYFGVIKYVKWNFIYSLFVDVAYLLIGMGLSIVVLYLRELENQRYDSNL